MSRELVELQLHLDYRRLKSGESDIEIINLKLRALVKQHDLFFDLHDHLLRVLFLLDQQLLVKNQSILRVAVEQP